MQKHFVRTIFGGYTQNHHLATGLVGGIVFYKPFFYCFFFFFLSLSDNSRSNKHMCYYAFGRTLA